MVCTTLPTTRPIRADPGKVDRRLAMERDYHVSGRVPPYTCGIGFNNSGTGDTNVTDAPNWNPNFKGSPVLGTVDHWFDPRAFTLPTPGTFGNVSRGSIRGPGLVNVDTSLFKKFRISERFNLQLRAEAFNIFNHSNFFYPNLIVFSGNSASSTYSDTAGQITAAAQSRQLNLALKLIF